MLFVNRLRNTGNCLYIPRALSSFWPVGEYEEWRCDNPYFELYSSERTNLPRIPSEIGLVVALLAKVEAQFVEFLQESIISIIIHSTVTVSLYFFYYTILFFSFFILLCRLFILLYTETYFHIKNMSICTVFRFFCRLLFFIWLMAMITSQVAMSLAPNPTLTNLAYPCPNLSDIIGLFLRDVERSHVDLVLADQLFFLKIRNF